MFASSYAVSRSRSSKAKSPPLLLLTGFCRCVLLEWAQWLSRHLQLPAGEAPRFAWLSLPWRQRLGALAMWQDAPGYDDLARGSSASLHSLFQPQEEWAAWKRRPEKNLTNWRENSIKLLFLSFCGFDLRSCTPREASPSWIHPSRPPHAPTSWCMMYFQYPSSPPSPPAFLKFHLFEGPWATSPIMNIPGCAGQATRSRVWGTHSCVSCCCDPRMDGWPAWAKHKSLEIFKHRLVCDAVAV